MQNSDHVESGFIRKVLTGEKVNIKDAYGAAYIAHNCFAEDSKAQHISFLVMDERQAALDAMDCYLRNNDICKAVGAMRRFWSV